MEGDVGRFRRRHLVPVPEVDSIEELNERLEEACWQDLERTITGREGTVGQRLDRERPILNNLPCEPHPTWEEATPRVDSKALATVRCNSASCPKTGLGETWGGTIGNITQEVGNYYAPASGDEVDVSFAKLPAAFAAVSNPLSGRLAAQTAAEKGTVRVVTRR